MEAVASTGLKVLIVDDNPVNITVLDSFVRKLGFDTLCAESGKEALAIFERERPNIVLLDLMMPDMNGAEVAQRIRVMSGAHWVPIVMVSASSQEADRSLSLTQGADAYLTKPVTFQALASKLTAMQRIASLQHQLEVQLDELQRYHDYIEEEQRLARYIMRHLAPAPQLEGLCALIRPASCFSGDYLSAVERPNGRIYLILADATGHGLSAAVCLVPIFTIFEGMVKKDLSLAQIAREMNLELKQRMPTGYFAAVTLVLVDREQGVTEVWNGGNPPALLLYDEQQTEIESQHPPVGLLRDDRFDASTQRVQWQRACSVLLVSDGVTEASDADGRQLGFPAVRALFQARENAVCDALLNRIETHLDGQPADDDVSILGLTAERIVSSETAHDACNADAGSPGCFARLRLGPSQIRSLDIADLLDHWSRTMNWPAHLKSQISLAATELLVNALDHGLLQLDSKIKEQPDGIERYFKMRAEKLAQLKQGFIDITIETQPAESRCEVVVSVEDSGPGFDFRPWLATAEHQQKTFSGRGLRTVESMAHALSFGKDGRLIKAHFLS